MRCGERALVGVGIPKRSAGLISSLLPNVDPALIKSEELRERSCLFLQLQSSSLTITVKDQRTDFHSLVHKH